LLRAETTYGPKSKCPELNPVRSHPQLPYSVYVIVVNHSQCTWLALDYTTCRTRMHLTDNWNQSAVKDDTSHMTLLACSSVLPPHRTMCGMHCANFKSACSLKKYSLHLKLPRCAGLFPEQADPVSFSLIPRPSPKAE